MQNHRSTPLWLALALALATSPAVSQDVMLERVKNMLELGVEETPGQDSWILIGVESVEYLHAIARDADEAPIYRQRAAIALGHFDEPRVPGLLTELVLTGSMGPDLRVAALTALAGKWPQDAIARARTLLSEDDNYLRRLVVRALGEMLVPAADDLLEEQLAREQDEIVRTEADAARSRLRESLARRRLDALEVTFSGAKLLISGATEDMHLALSLDAPDHVVFTPGRELLLEVLAGETVEVDLGASSTDPDGDTSFRILMREQAGPEVERRIDVPTAR
jgi:hypothetical protein